MADTVVAWLSFVAPDLATAAGAARLVEVDHIARHLASSQIRVDKHPAVISDHQAPEVRNW